MSLTRRLLTYSCLFLFSSLAALAQISGDLKGRVLDASGAAVASARVELTQSSTSIKQSTTSTSEGYYSFSQLTPGVYQLDVTATGFQHLTRNRHHRHPRPDRQRRPDAQRRRRSADRHGQRPTRRFCRPKPATSRPTSPAHTVVAMPLNTRNFVQLATLAPGVELPPGTLLPRINGGRPRTNEYLYDGISALQPEPGQVAFFPILDDIQEFTVEANNVPAEFGRFNGGVVNVATRSGSNAFHGSLFEFFRNEDLNARNYFASPPAPQTRVPAQSLRRHPRRPHPSRSSLLLRRLSGSQATHRRHPHLHHPDARRTAGHLHRRFAHLRPDDTTVVNGKSRSPGISQRRHQQSLRSGRTVAARALPHAHQSDRRGQQLHPHRQRHRSSEPVRRPRRRRHRRSRDRAFGRYSYLQRRRSSPSRLCPTAAAPSPAQSSAREASSGLSNVLGQQAVFNETHIFSAASAQRLPTGLHAPRQHHRRHRPWTTPRPPRSAFPASPPMPHSTMRCRSSPSPASSSLAPLPAPSRNTRPACGRCVDTVVFTQRPSRLQGRPRLPLVSAQRRLAAQPDRLFRLHHHRHQPAGRHE